MIADLDEEELRARETVKWGVSADGVLPCWVAETDFAPCPAVQEAVQDAVSRGSFGYPLPDCRTALPEATAGVCDRWWDWHVDPADVVLVTDVMAGVLLALTTLCESAPVVVPTPTYPPFLDVVPLAGREIWTLPLDPDAQVATLDLDRVDAMLAAGARTVLLCNPHNPWGRAFAREELEALRDVVVRHRARVVSDDVHAPLVLPGARHVPYATLGGTAAHTTTVLSASKAFNVPGLKCAQVVAGSPADRDAVQQLPLVANHGPSPLGIVANLAAYRAGDEWLSALVDRLGQNRKLIEDLLARCLPGVRMRPLDATYLAWLDVRALGHEDPAAVALERGRVLVSDGRTFGPGGDGHVRLNIATSPERLSEAVRRLAEAWL